ncbi:glycosyltransferase family 2 protein [Propionibacteriaceae bacterium G1746]|uniref:glycosyltransferase family 2 protein n=1 Tax=Aestuariimicrobium sp. G57 TaxID=3418485 RepID=UPI003C142BBE
MNPIEASVSVVMPVRNGAGTIQEQLRALARQEYSGSWEVVVADNGSTDATRRIVEAFARTAAMPVRLVDASARAGASHARNVGARASTGVVLAFCDCDDRVDSGWVSGAAEAQQCEVLAGILKPLSTPQDPDAPILYPDGFIQAATMRTLMSSNFAIWRSDYLSLGGFDESLPPYGFEDTEFAIRLHARGLRLNGSQQMLVHYRLPAQNRRLLRKVFLSAKAETVLWHRYPRMAAGTGVHWAASQVLRLPVDVFRGPSRSPRRIAREVVTRWGRLVATCEIRLGRYPSEPRLLDPEAMTP